MRIRSDDCTRSPMVTIGVPVYNGSEHLEGTLTSLLDQTFDDFEVVISDNASTDSTEKICAAFAARDERVRVERSHINIGLARNFNRAFALSRGRYFRWAMADDVVSRSNLADCVAVLQDRPDVVLAVPGWDLVDEFDDPATHDRQRAAVGRFIWDDNTDRRMGQLIRMLAGPRSLAVLPYLSGLVRSEALWATGLLGSYPMSDHVLLVELAALGNFHEIDRHSMSIRLHSSSAGYGISIGDYASVWPTFFPQRMPPQNLFLWRAQVYAQVVRMLGRAGGPTSVRLRRIATYATATAGQTLRSRKLLPTHG